MKQIYLGNCDKFYFTFEFEYQIWVWVYQKFEKDPWYRAFLLTLAFRKFPTSVALPKVCQAKYSRLFVAGVIFK